MSAQSPSEKSFTLDGKKIQGEISTEFGPDFFSTDKNAVKIVLMQYRDAIQKQAADWITFAAIIIALISPFITADFKNFLGIDPIYWKILFETGLVLCSIKIITLVLNAVFFYHDVDIETVIEDIRRGNTEVRSNSILRIIGKKLNYIISKIL
jgi:hypothetical protein